MTGKIVCSNCHLSNRDVTFNVPALCIAGKLVEGVISIPVLHTNAALRSDGSVSNLNVGGVLVLEGSSGVTSSIELTPWSTSVPGAYLFGPNSSKSMANSFVISWRAPISWAGVSKTFYVAANRGRGQIYPNGSPSNLTGWKIPSDATSASAAVSAGVVYQPKRYGSVVALLTTRGIYLLHVPAGQPVVRTISLKTCSSSDTSIGAYLNLGGFGQTEQTLSFQQQGQVDVLLAYLLCLHATQVALVAKKKQYERCNL